MRRRSASRLAALALALAAALAGPAATAIAAECPRTTLADVEDEVMCPVCGTPLALALEAPQAQREREFIRRLIDRCRSKAQVKRALVAEFGEDVLALPGDEEEDDLGDVAVYAVPVVAILLAIAAITVAVVRWRRGWTRPAPVADSEEGEGGAPAGAHEPRRPRPPSGAAEAKLDSDLERYDL